MASLYDAIRKPWASWPMTLEGHDPTNFRVLDVSGNGRHLTLGNGAGANQPTKLTQKRGYRNAGTNYLTRQNEAWTSNRLTAEILYANPTNSSGYVVSFGSSDAEVFDMRKSSDIRFYVGSRSSANNAARYSQLNQTCVSSGVVRYNGINTELFFDGVKVSQAVTPLAPIAGTYDINMFALGFMQCDLYLCRIWDVALTDVQIRELARRAKQELTRI